MLVKKIGLVVAPGCRGTDIVGVLAILGLNALTHRCVLIGESLEPVMCANGLRLVPDVTRETCPQLDVLVIGALSEASQQEKAWLDFLEATAPQTPYVLGMSSGVIALAMAGLLQGRKFTTDTESASILLARRFHATRSHTFVHDRGMYTSGPSAGGLEAAFEILGHLAGHNMGRWTELNLEYNPTQRFASYTPEAPADTEQPLKVGVLMAPGMYLPDVVGAVETFGALPHVEFVYVGSSTEPMTTALGPSVVPDTMWDVCPELDVLILGANRPGLCADKDVLRFLRDQAPHVQAFVGVCAGSLLLGAAGLLKGVRATSNFHMTGLLGRCEIEPAHTEVMAFGRYYTAGPAVGSYEAALLAIADLYGEPIAAHLERDVLEYQPYPVFGVGTPERAGPMLTFLSKTLSMPLLPFYSRSLKKGFQTSEGPNRQ